MKVVTLAAGVAVGYLLGTRAGREKYEQIVASARKVSSHPSVVQAQNKAKELLGTGAGAAPAKPAGDETYPPVTTGTAVPRPPRRKPTEATPGVTTTQPLV